MNTAQYASVQIHGFSDASIRTYGFCIYIRSRESDKVLYRSITAKSKVAPLKTKSLPRFELCAAHLLANLWNLIKKMLNFEIESVHFWSDSEITLHWIRSHPSSLTEIAEIQEWTTNVSWCHVPTKCNPADLVSTGCDVNELRDSIWFEGPAFLLQESANGQ